MSRELDSVTPNFKLTAAQIANLKRILTDDDYAEERYKEYEQHKREHINKLKTMLETGLSSKGTVLPESVLKEVKIAYESISGRKFDEVNKS